MEIGNWLNTLRCSSLLGSSLAYFPWLHERFMILSLSLFVYFLISAKPGRKALLLSLLPLVVSGILQAAYYHLLYGIPIPIREGWYEESYVGKFGFWNKEGIYVGILGLLFDRAEGLFVFSPLYAFIFLGMMSLSRERRRDFWWLITVFFSYYLLIGSHGYWWGAAGPPPRFIVTVIPLSAIPLAYCLKKITLKSFRGIFAFFLLLSLFLGFSLMRDPSPLYIFGQHHHHGFAFKNLPVLADLQSYLPSFYRNKAMALWLTLFWFSLIMGISFYFYHKSSKRK